MESSLEKVTGWLSNAASRVESHYFQLPVFEMDKPEYRERVYCYELYHQWRSQWDSKFRYFLNGEVDKRGHPIIRGNNVPDFLVHIPGEMNNLLVLEVKIASASISSMVYDLIKLTKFRVEEANYFAAYFLIYGLSLESWSSQRAKILSVAKNRSFDPNLVKCLLHSSVGEQPIFVDWT